MSTMNRRNARRLAACVLVFAPGLAHAQSDSGTRKVDLSLNATVTYDSNVARGSEAVQDARVVKPGDYIYAPSATIDSFLPLGRGSVYLTGHVGYAAHQRNKKLNSEDIHLSGGGQYQTGPCQVAVRADIDRSQTDLADLALSTTVNVGQSINIDPSVSCGFGAFSGSVGYSYGKTTNSSDQVPGSTTKGFNGSLGYQNRLLGKVSLNAGYSKSSYPSDPTRPPQPGFKNYSASIGIQRAITRRLNGDATLGYSSEHSEDPQIKNFNGVTGSGDLSYMVSSRLTANLNYRRGIQSSIQPGVDYTLSENVGGSLTYQLSTRIATSLGASINKTTSEGQLIAIPGVIDNDQLKSVFGSVTLKIGRNSSLTFTGGYDDRVAKPSVFSYTAYRMGVAAATKF